MHASSHTPEIIALATRIHSHFAALRPAKATSPETSAMVEHGAGAMPVELVEVNFGTEADDVPLIIPGEKDSPAPLHEPTQKQFIQLLEFLEQDHPEVFKAIQKLFPADPSQAPSPYFSLQLTAWLLKNVAITGVAVGISLSMFVEYMFSALSEIEGDEGYVFGTGAFTGNAALSNFFLIPFILSLGTGRFWRNVAGTIEPWTPHGREVLAKAYGENSVRFYYEMTKPMLSIVLKFWGTIASASIASAFVQNTEDAYKDAGIERPEIAEAFSQADYESFWKYANLASIPMNTLLFAIDYTLEIARGFDTDIAKVNAYGPQPHFLEMAFKAICDAGSAIRHWDTAKIRDLVLGVPGEETPTAEDKMHYIVRYMGSKQDRLEAVLKEWLQEAAARMPEDGSDIPVKTKLELLENLKDKLAEILKSVDGHWAFQAYNRISFVVSAYTSYEYCMGAAGLFPKAYHNPNLSFIKWAIALLGADTEKGSEAAALVAVAPFATKHSTTGANMARDYVIAAAHSTSGANMALVILMGLITMGWAALTAMTAKKESGSDIGAFKGATVNAVGIEAFVRFFALMLIPSLVTGVIVGVQSLGSSCTRPFARAQIGTAAERQAITKDPESRQSTTPSGYGSV